MRLGYTFFWRAKGAIHESVVSHKCPLCKHFAVVRLPEALQGLQPDDTTHVCHPSIGGCNHGFALTALTPPGATASNATASKESTP
jgi:hypothetical protein